MLKIKNNIDLKELEKYGFELYKNFYYDDDEITKLDCYLFDCNDNRTYVRVDVKTKEIALHSGLFGDSPEYYFDTQLDVLYDLIKDGLVEKVEE